MGNEEQQHEGSTTNLHVRIVALFVIFVAGFLGVATPCMVHRLSTGRWPGSKHTCCDDEEDAGEASGTGEGAGPRRLDSSARFRGSVVAPSSCKMETREARSGLNYMHVVKLLSAVGCGAIIATATCHIAPSAHKLLNDALDDPEYPYVMLIATGVLVLMYILEHELTLQLQMREHRKAQLASEPSTDHHNHGLAPDGVSPQEGGAVRQPSAVSAPRASCCEHQPVTKTDSPNEDVLETDGCDRSKLIRASIATHVLEIGVAVHSVIVGFAMGMMTDNNQARNLTIALTFHQFCEGSAIGAAVMESRLSVRHTALLWVIFTLTAPVGVALGIMVQQIQNVDGENQGWRLQLTQGVLESIALGILLYMSLVDMMPHLFKLPAPDDADSEAVADACPANQTLTRHHRHSALRHSDAAARPARSAPASRLPSLTPDHSPLIPSATRLSENNPTLPTKGAPQAAVQQQVYGTCANTFQNPPLEDGARPPPLSYRVLVYACLCLGAGIMCLLAKWA